MRKTSRDMPHPPAPTRPGPPLAHGDRRRGPRAATVFTIGKISVGELELHCMVRDLSAGGMRIQMHSPPPPGSRVVIEMRGLAPTHARVRWVSGRDAGLSFDQECDVANVFEARLSRHGHVARSPRFAIMREGRFVTDTSAVDVMVWDISAGGVKLLIEEPLTIDMRGTVAIGFELSGGPLHGRICWMRQDACGVQFDRPLSSVALSTALHAARI